jgi:hypothetical protein
MDDSKREATRELLKDELESARLEQIAAIANFHRAVEAPGADFFEIERASSRAEAAVERFRVALHRLGDFTLLGIAPRHLSAAN